MVKQYLNLLRNKEARGNIILLIQFICIVDVLESFNGMFVIDFVNTNLLVNQYFLD